MRVKLRCEVSDLGDAGGSGLETGCMDSDSWGVVSLGRKLSGLSVGRMAVWVSHGLLAQGMRGSSRPLAAGFPQWSGVFLRT